MMLLQLYSNCRTITSCWNNLLTSTTLQQVVKKPLTSCQQAGNKQFRNILKTLLEQQRKKSAVGLLQAVRFYVCSTIDRWTAHWGKASIPGSLLLLYCR